MDNIVYDLDKSASPGKIIHVDIQPILNKYKKLFEEIPPGLRLKRGFEHPIELEEGEKPIMILLIDIPRSTKKR